MSVLFLPEVQKYFYELEDILYEKGYLSFEYTAHEYVDDLIYNIKNNLSSTRHKPAPKYYEKYGKGLYYATFKKNRQTQWYTFFQSMLKTERLYI